MTDPFLLTPGPLTTSASVKAAMLRDWGSRDPAFIDMNQRIRNRLLEIADGCKTHVCVPVQGSGTFAVEATIGSLVPRNGKLLVLVNGAYGRRMVEIARLLNRNVMSIERDEDAPVSAEQLDQALSADQGITHVAFVHCETTTGLLNPLEQVAAIARQHNRSLLVDAMSSFGALPVSVADLRLEAVMASANKCLEGAPGLGFAIVCRDALLSAEGHAASLCLDLHAQWRGFEDNGQWRFTPPTHVLAALDQALTEHAAEGGVAGRGARYRRNLDALISGMTELGFVPLLPASLQAPIIVTFRMPADPAFHFETFYERLRGRGYVIYPGKLTVADSFRMGCIGRLDTDHIRGATAAVKSVLAEMDVSSGAPLPWMVPA